ncbi:MAG: RNA methyltransferase [Flavobacteriales bacterium]|nr:RNA methyltransferase [Flavobacteriales bacterium]
MSTKAELKRVRSLHQKKFRDQEGVFLVQGRKMLAELKRSGLYIEAIYVSDRVEERALTDEALALPQHELDRIGTLEAGNEVVAVVRKPASAPLGALRAGELVLAMDGVADPGNLGTVLRIADWFGSRRVVCQAGSVDVFNPKCVQSSMGAVLRVEVAYTDLGTYLAERRAEGSAIYCATMEGSSVFEVQLRRPAVLVLGNESHGLSEAVLATGTPISVPRSGGAESLNVAMAAAALCMEFERQFRAG